MQRNLQKLLRRTMGLPFHPQWFTRKEAELIQFLQTQAGGSLVLDIGCADKWIKAHLPAEVTYLGLDYPLTSEQMYHSLPDVFASAENLPFATSAIDTVYVLDVLEHIKHPLIAMQEVSRVLKKSGSIILRVPFLYPIHDAPIDFTRFTIYGIQTLATECGLKILRAIPLGHPFETSALMRNLAYAKTVIDLVHRRNPLCLLGLALPLYFLVNNLLSFLLARLAPNTTIMPHTYLVQLQKVV